MEFKVFRCNEGDKKHYDENLKFWSNAAGDLHRHGQEDLSVEELPPELQRAYNALWGEDYHNLCYLVETTKGYGVALICEYDDYTAELYSLKMDSLFECVEKDGKTVADHLHFKNAEVFVSEHGGFLECHELVVVFPADTPIAEFEAAEQTLARLAYSEPLRRYNKALCADIGNFFGKYFEENGYYGIDNGEKVFLYESPDALLVDWVDTLVENHHDMHHFDDEGREWDSWEKEIQHIYCNVAKKLPAGIRQAGLCWECSVEVTPSENIPYENLNLGIYTSIVDAIYARKDFLNKSEELRAGGLDALITAAKEQQETAKDLNKTSGMRRESR